MGGAPLLHPLQAVFRNLQEGGGNKTRYPAQGERAAVTGLYYRKLLHKDKVINWIAAHILTDSSKNTHDSWIYTKCADLAVQL